MSADNKAKGIFIMFMDRTGKVFYQYPPYGVTLKEFETWVMEELNMGIKKGQKKHVQMSAVMVKFDVLDEEDAKEIEEKRLLASAQQNKGKKGHHHRKSHAPGRNSPTPDSGRVSPSGHK